MVLVRVLPLATLGIEPLVMFLSRDAIAQGSQSFRVIRYMNILLHAHLSEAGVSNWVCPSVISVVSHKRKSIFITCNIDATRLYKGYI